MANKPDRNGDVLSPKMQQKRDEAIEMFANEHGMSARQPMLSEKEVLRRNLAGRLCGRVCYPEPQDEFAVFQRVVAVLEKLNLSDIKVCLRAADDMQQCHRLKQERARAELIEQVRCL